MKYILFSCLFYFGNLVEIVLAEKKTICSSDPKNWCESIESASKCNVIEQCSKYVWYPSKKVNLDLYYESMCPGCREFISYNGQLWNAYKYVSSIMNLKLIPYGNAKETWNILTNSWEFVCQHGEDECWGNMFHSCLINLYPKTDEHLPFITCMESNDIDTIRISALKCSKLLNVTIDLIERCMNSSIGNKIQHDNALLTEKLNPPHKYVPWIVLNDVHTEEIEQDALNDLVKLICENYLDTDKPSICFNQLSD